MSKALAVQGPCLVEMQRSPKALEAPSRSSMILERPPVGPEPQACCQWCEFPWIFAPAAKKPVTRSKVTQGDCDVLASQRKIQGGEARCPVFTSSARVSTS